MSDGLNQLIFTEQWWIYFNQLTSLFSIFLTILGPFFAWVLRYKIRAWFHGRAYSIKEKKLTDFKYDGLIITFSNKDLALWQLNEIKPKYCALLTTESKKAESAYVEEYCGNNNILCEISEIKNIESVDEVRQRAKDCAELLFRHCENVSIDITGGTKPMGVGAFSAAIDLNLDCLYSRSEKKGSKFIQKAIVIIGKKVNG